MAQSEFTIGSQWQTDKRSTTRWLLSHLLRNKLIITGTFVGAFGNAALAAAIPIYMGQAFNAVLGNPVNMPALLWASILLAVSQLVRSVLQLGRNFSSETLGQRLERDARQELYASLLGKSMRFHDMHATGDLMARATNDMRELSLMVAPGLNLVIGSANFLLMPLVVAPTIHPSLIATPLVFAIAYAWALRAYILDLNPVTAQVRSTFGTLNARLTEAVEGIETVKGAARENDEIALFEQNARSFRDAFVHRGKIEARFLPLLLLGLAQGVAFMHSLYLYRGGTINVGDLVSYMGLIALFGFPTFVSLFAYSQVSTGYSSAERILELIREETELDQNEGGYAAPIKGAIRFEKVDFGYGIEQEGDAVGDQVGSTASRQLALTDISFAIEPGQTLALVGQTGSGKSTVSKLINRIYDVSAGSIFVDGVDVREWDLAALREGISIIEQDIFLFSRTIGENIAFGRPEITQAEIEAAATAAQAHDFITSFPDGYDTVIGERGVMLSGGQRQRLALARAFLTDPAILILDDSTSAIDSATEDKIQRAIEAASRGRTTILITHRLSQIRWADKIVVLRKGRIAAVGSHEELLASSKAYQEIFARY